MLATIYKESAEKLKNTNTGDDYNDISAAFKYGYEQTEQRLAASAKPNWSAFRNEMTTMIEAKWKQGMTQKSQIIAILQEMAQALELVK